MVLAGNIIDVISATIHAWTIVHWTYSNTHTLGAPNFPYSIVIPAQFIDDEYRRSATKEKYECSLQAKIESIKTKLNSEV